MKHALSPRHGKARHLRGGGALPYDSNMDPSDESMLRRTGGEAGILAGAGYAVLLQIAHPDVARGVADHSDFASRPLDRLRGTLYYVYGVSLGTEEERARVGAIVRALHRKVRGPGYDALDPELLLWVAATLYHSGARLYELVLGERSEQERELLLRESARYGTSLGLPEEHWPASLEEFEKYWERACARLEVGPEARALARDLFRPNNRLLWPLTAAQRFISGGLLPPDLREAFGIPWSPAHQRRFDRLFRMVGAVYPRLPRGVRTLPSTLYLRSMRRGGGWKKRRRGSGSAGRRARVS